MKKYFITFLILFNFFSWHANAQDTAFNITELDTFVLDTKIHSPAHAAMLSAAFPGLGQIYNKKYWKLPFIYGGAVTLIYYINKNNETYKFYREAYYDAEYLGVKNEEFVKKYLEVNPNAEPDKPTLEYIIKKSKDGKEDFLKYREYCIMGLVALYLANIIDANVDAYFINFDVSKDLTLKLKPFVDNSLLSENIIGVKLSLDYK